ncbi:hypothetical protein CFP56_009680 [Quercus suber]|uniref:Uncharacterized protein n=1 Tax=Quercus suber TaxID=58331 RepID=A0AAW0L0N1_QUESU
MKTSHAGEDKERLDHYRFSLRFSVKFNQFSQISVPLFAAEQSQNWDFLPSAKSSSKVCTSHFTTPFFTVLIILE